MTIKLLLYLNETYWCLLLVTKLKVRKQKAYTIP